MKQTNEPAKIYRVTNKVTGQVLIDEAALGKKTLAQARWWSDWSAACDAIEKDARLTGCDEDWDYDVQETTGVCNKKGRIIYK